jgi:hypothetical protein
MQFISKEDMNKFTELGYTFTSKYTPNKLGNTYHVIVTDKKGNEVVHTQSSYANGSGHGYAMSGAETQAVADLKAYIENPNQATEKYNTEFLEKLVEWGYITDYGYTTDDELVLLFDGWSQVEGTKVYNKKKQEWELVTKSPYAKLAELAEKNLLKPSINKTIKEVGYVFSDQYQKCDQCGKLLNTEWEGIQYLDRVGMSLCDDCVNESESAIEALIEEAKDDFSKALPVMISEDKLAEMGYEKLDEQNISTRYETWHEESWSAYNVHHSVIEELCEKYNGFPKLEGVWQFESEYNALFPTETIEQARKEFKAIVG